MFAVTIPRISISTIAQQHTITVVDILTVVAGLLTVAISAIALWVSIYSARLARQVRKAEQERDQREIERDRRGVKDFLDYVHFLEIARRTIINVGFRPITITGISLRPEGSDQVPGNALLNDRHLEE